MGRGGARGSVQFKAESTRWGNLIIALSTNSTFPSAAVIETVLVHNYTYVT